MNIGKKEDMQEGKKKKEWKISMEGRMAKRENERWRNMEQDRLERKKIQSERKEERKKKERTACMITGEKKDM